MEEMPRSFKIFDASAGSGKTFTLTLEYLTRLLKPGSRQAFRQMLAITFTNKAVAELKHRILRNLELLAEATETTAADTTLDPLITTLSASESTPLAITFAFPRISIDESEATVIE